VLTIPNQDHCSRLANISDFVSICALKVSKKYDEFAEMEREFQSNLLGKRKVFY